MNDEKYQKHSRYNIKKCAKKYNFTTYLTRTLTCKEDWFQEQLFTTHHTLLLPYARNQTHRLFKMDYPELPTVLSGIVLVIRDYHYLRIWGMWVYATNFQLCRSGGSSRTKDSSGM
jgi:hypothetical protein